MPGSGVISRSGHCRRQPHRCRWRPSPSSPSSCRPRPPYHVEGRETLGAPRIVAEEERACFLHLEVHLGGERPAALEEIIPLSGLRRHCRAQGGEDLTGQLVGIGEVRWLVLGVFLDESARGFIYTGIPEQIVGAVEVRGPGPELVEDGSVHRVAAQVVLAYVLHVGLERGRGGVKRCGDLRRTLECSRLRRFAVDVHDDNRQVFEVVDTGDVELFVNPRPCPS